MTMPDVNFVHVLVAGLVAMVLGGLWYSKILFGKSWMLLAGINEEAAKKEAPMAYLKMFITALVAAYVLAVFVGFAGAATFAEGAIVGFWLWLGFIFTVTMSSVIFEKRPWKLWLINNGYQVILLVISGGLLAAWK
ncbi:MAG: DUF1761 domain-containing protein [Patescibacteria group bacterium]